MLWTMRALLLITLLSGVTSACASPRAAPPRATGGGAATGSGPVAGGSGRVASGHAGVSGRASAGAAGSEQASCTSGQPAYQPPDLDKSCSSLRDCFVAAHRADCCGSQVLLAYHVSARPAFETYERGCPIACDCESRPTVAEDGSPARNAAQAAAECTGGTCRATLRDDR